MRDREVIDSESPAAAVRRVWRSRSACDPSADRRQLLALPGTLHDPLRSPVVDP
jgi:hypothetical protein